MNLDLDQEIENSLAKLPSAERLRFLGKDFNLQRELGKKREDRRALAKLSPAKKLRILEELRIRNQIQRGSRRMASPSDANNSSQSSRLGDSNKKKKGNVLSLPSRAGSHRFGGRATAGGVNYEVRVAAFIAVKMLSGNQCSVWDGINGAELSAITMQAPEPVDDIVVSLRGDTEACVFISAKERSATIALTNKSPAFTDTVNAFVQQFLKLSIAARAKCRLVWAVPSSVGRATAHELLDVLETHRKDAGDTSLSEFYAVGRPKKWGC